jgi:3',5'-cyclic AMP phosphodiesterase CpdA
MKLWATSDLHVGHPANRDAIQALPDYGDDWLIVAGDVGETLQQLMWTMSELSQRFGKVIWVPGNHELYVVPKDVCQARGVARYETLVAACREIGVLTPEDAWPLWPGDGPSTVIAPSFLFYDYSFGPLGYTADEVKAWAREAGIVCSDERYLSVDPYPTREAWCHARLAYTAARLDALDPAHRIVLINHYPLRSDLVRLFRIPRFIPWCGTRRTEDWHTRWNVDTVVSGHLHMRATDWRDGVRFEEVSLGYPRHWNDETGLVGYLRQILPVPGERVTIAGPNWHR